MTVRNAFGLLALDTTVAAVRDKVEAVRALLAGTIAVAGPATNTELRATPLPVAPGPVDLSTATLAALEQITAVVSNWPSDFPDAAVLAKVETVRALLAGTLTVGGTVALGSPTITALTARTDFPDATAATALAGIDTKLAGTLAVSGPATNTQLRATPLPVSGTVDLSSAALTALETITAIVSNWPSDYPDAAVLAKVEAVRALLAGTLTVSGTVGISGTVPVSGPLTDTQLRASDVGVLSRDKITAAAGTSVLANVGDAGTVTVPTGARTAYATLAGSFTGANMTFEGSSDGGTTWFGVYAMSAASGSGGPLSGGTTGAISSTAHYVIAVQPGIGLLRPRLTALTAGGPVTVTWNFGSAPGLLLGTVDTEMPGAAALADGQANQTTPTVGADGLLYNGSTWDRARGNHTVTADTGAARSSSGNGTTQTNYNARGALILINATAVTGSGNVTYRLEWSPDGGTTWATIDATNLTTTAVTAISTRTLLIYPGVANTANASASLPLPRTWRVAWTLNSGTSVTSTHTVSYIV